MTLNVVILNGAKADFREIKKNVKLISANPLFGTHIDELGPFGYDNYRKTLVRQTRVIYEFDSQQLIIHMFIHTRRDFKTHLEKRLFAPA